MAEIAKAQSNRDHTYDVLTDMPGYKHWHGLRRAEDTYTFFLDKFVRQIIGARKFDKWAVAVPLSRFAKVSDEAFALLVYENQEERWKTMLNDNVKRSRIPAKYTDGGYCGKESGRSRRAKGWDNAGIEQFNTLCAMVLQDRRSEHAQAFEQSYLEHRRDVQDSKRSRHAKKKGKVYQGDQKVVESVLHEMDADFVDLGWTETSTPMLPVVNDSGPLPDTPPRQTAAM